MFLNKAGHLQGKNRKRRDEASSTVSHGGGGCLQLYMRANVFEKEISGFCFTEKEAVEIVLSDTADKDNYVVSLVIHITVTERQILLKK